MVDADRFRVDRYDKYTGNGGSNGATMRFAPEANHGANAGLEVARGKLEQVKKQFPQITYSDLWTLAGVCAIQEMGGPHIAWRAGRKDGKPPRLRTSRSARWLTSPPSLFLYR